MYIEKNENKQKKKKIEFLALLNFGTKNNLIFCLSSEIYYRDKLMSYLKKIYITYAAQICLKIFASLFIHKYPYLR